MPKFKRWLKARLRRWLELDTLTNQVIKLDTLTKDLVNIGVEVHFKEPHMILIYSRLNGGQIREVRADFNSINELNRFVESLKARFNTRSEIWDKPRGVNWL